MTNYNFSNQQDELESFYQQDAQPSNKPNDVEPSSPSNSIKKTQQNPDSHREISTNDSSTTLDEFYRQQEPHNKASFGFTAKKEHAQATSTSSRPNPDSYFNSRQQVNAHLLHQAPELGEHYTLLLKKHSQLASNIPHRVSFEDKKLNITTAYEQHLSIRLLKFSSFLLVALSILYWILLITHIPTSLAYDSNHQLLKLATIFNLIQTILYYGIPAVLFWASASLTAKFKNELLKTYRLEQRHYYNHEQVIPTSTQQDYINQLARLQSTKVLSNVVCDRNLLDLQKGSDGVNLLHTILCGKESELVSLNHFAEVSYHAKIHPELTAVEVLDYYEEKFLKQLDTQAQTQIVKIAKRISVTTGLSQWSLIDMLLIYIAAMKLIERIANIYDVQISTTQRLLLTRKILILVAVGGATEELTDSVTELFSNGLVAKYLGDVTQGLSNGVLMMRFGLKTIELLRPLPYKSKRPTMISMLKSFVKFTKKVDTD